MSLLLDFSSGTRPEYNGLQRAAYTTAGGSHTVRFLTTRQPADVFCAVRLDPGARTASIYFEHLRPSMHAPRPAFLPLALATMLSEPGLTEATRVCECAAGYYGDDVKRQTSAQLRAGRHPLADPKIAAAVPPLRLVP